MAFHGVIDIAQFLNIFGHKKGWPRYWTKYNTQMYSAA